MKIKILTIEGCSKCAKVKDFLAEYGLEYIDVPCESNPKDCDYAEKVTSSYNYPMILIEEDSGKKKYIYGEDNYESLRPKYLLSLNIMLIPKHSTDSMITWMKNNLYS